MKKKIIAILLTLVIGVGCMPLANAENSSAPQLYSVYGDGMLLQQNETSFISGTGTPGDEIALELHGKNGVIFESSAQVKDDGTFSVALSAPNGGFDEYTIILKVNGDEFEALENILFGELWLANGQSNMQYPLVQEKYGRDLYANQEKLDKNLRVLLVPDIPEYKGSKELVPADPQKDAPGSTWVDGENTNAYIMSAVAYYFAQKLAETSDVPVGIINVPLGGTTIAAWLSREAIDSDKAVKNALISKGTYIEKSDWNESKVDVYHDMTTNYNLKMEAIKDFRISGMIWYQGESDIMVGWNDEEYKSAFSLMQKTYTELFSYTDGLLPIVCTQLASFYYSEKNTELFNRNIAFTQLQQENADSTAVVAIHDLPLTYIPEAGSIHPETKKEIGERMAFAAQGLVYSQRDTYTTATVKSTEVRDGSIFVTLKNVGDGLTSNGKLQGFAVCAADGVYVQANAEIVSNDTVRVWNNDVKNPVSATYAYYTNNTNASLFATENGELALPVSAFVTDESVGTHYWVDKFWASCDSSEIWHIEGDEFSGMYPTWEADDAILSFSENALKIKKDTVLRKFSVNPVLTYKDGILKKSLSDVDVDYTDYGKMSFSVRNNGESDVTLKGTRFYVNDASWYAPAVDGTKSPQTVIPADGEWHKITLDLDRNYLSGNEGGIAYSNERLDTVKNIKFVFSAEFGEDADLSLDGIEFTPSTQDSGPRFDPDIKNADNILEVISTLAVSIIGLIANLFI